jgi:hypothetical protein
MRENYPYFPGRQLDESGLLSRFLPPIPEDLIYPWIDNRVPTGSLIFDPFGASPDLALQVARGGYKVLTCVNNPIARFLIALEANPPSEDDFSSALAELARSRIGNERLEIHLANLYQTECSKCGNPVIAEAFIWERDASSPHSKIYDCIHCGDSGERPVVQSDIDLSISFPATSMHRMRIIERISPTDETIRRNLAEALSVYLPRALYGLVTLVNRLESLRVSSPQDDPTNAIRQNCLIALVLFALDYGNNLWTHPSGRARPKQLSASPIFRENNIWFVLEKGALQLPSRLAPVNISVYPNLPQEKGGICVFEGPLRNLCEELDSTSFDDLANLSAVITAIPRHNQAYWTLSALWAGWIWGRETLGEFISVLFRRRYDWSWHCAALNNAFSTIERMVIEHTPVLGLIPEAESNFIQSTIVAAGQSNYSMKGISLRADKHFAQIHWDSHRESEKQITAPFVLEDQMQKLVVSSAINYLDQRGEPAPYITLHANALFNLANNKGISEGRSTSSAEEYSRIQHLIEKSLTYQHGFLRHGGSEKSLENAILWHQEINEPESMLSDKVESKIRQLIDDREGIELSSFDHLVCEIFRGMMTPDFGLVNNCIDSYCKKDDFQSGSIVFREQDKPGKRSLEIASNCLALHDLGSNLGFSTSGDNPVIWNLQKEISHVFFVVSTAEIGNIVFNSPYPANKSILVIPGARSKLLLYKIRKNFYLNQIINQGWRFLKFRHLRHLLDSPTLTRENLDIELNLDPLTESPAQMRLL